MYTCSTISHRFILRCSLHINNLHEFNEERYGIDILFLQMPAYFNCSVSWIIFSLHQA